MANRQDWLTVPRAWTIWAPGTGRVSGVLEGTRAAVLRRIRDRKANGEAFTGERPSPVTLRLRWDGATMHATDTNGR